MAQAEPVEIEVQVIEAERIVVKAGRVELDLGGPAKSTVKIDGNVVKRVRRIKLESGPETGFIPFVTFEIVGEVTRERSR